MEDSRTVVITGASQGLGYFAALNVARERQNWHVLMACRAPLDKANAAAAQIIAETGNKNVHVAELDLANLDSVRRFSAGLLSRLGSPSASSKSSSSAAADADLPPLVSLVCNAGGQFVANQKTVDGFEATFGTNHLGHFLLVNLLLKNMIDSGLPVRIINVASGTHDPAQKTGMPSPRIPPRMAALAYPEQDDDPQRPKEDASATGRRRYTTSKLCNVLFTYELARRLRKKNVTNISVSAFEPGFMPGTGLARDYNAIMRWAWDKILPAIGKLRGWHRPDRSGANMARLVYDTESFPDIDNKYFVPGPVELSSSVDSYDRNLQRRLWLLSNSLVKLDRKETPFKIKKVDDISTLPRVNQTEIRVQQQTRHLMQQSYLQGSKSWFDTDS